MSQNKTLCVCGHARGFVDVQQCFEPSANISRSSRYNVYHAQHLSLVS